MRTLNRLHNLISVGTLFSVVNIAVTFYIETFILLGQYVYFFEKIYREITFILILLPFKMATFRYFVKFVL